MIKRLEISGLHTRLSEEVQAYARMKIGYLDKYLSYFARRSAHVEIKLILENAKLRHVYTCEVIMYLPHEVITVKKSATNFEAATDLVEAKLKLKLKKYKNRHSRDSLFHKVARKLRRQTRLK